MNKDLKEALGCTAVGALVGKIFVSSSGYTAIGMVTPWGAGIGAGAVATVTIAGGIVGLAAYGGYKVISSNMESLKEVFPYEISIKKKAA